MQNEHKCAVSSPESYYFRTKEFCALRYDKQYLHLTVFVFFFFTLSILQKISFYSYYIGKVAQIKRSSKLKTFNLSSIFNIFRKFYSKFLSDTCIENTTQFTENCNDVS